MDKIIIASNNIKRKLLEEMDKNSNLESVKFISKKEVKDKLYFRYDKRSIYYLVKKYNLKVETAIMYLDNLLFIDDVKYDSDKLNFLVQIKKELTSENLLIYDQLFLELIKDKEVFIYDSIKSNSDKKMVSKLSTICSVKIITNKLDKYSHNIYKFNNITDEVEYIINYICQLYLSGISLNKIKLINVDEEYQNELNRLSLLYKLPINTKVTSSIYGSKIVSEFISKIDTLPPYLIIEELSKKYKQDTDKVIIDKIIEIINEYAWYDYEYKDILDLLIYDFKKTNISISKMDMMVEVIDIDDLNEDEIGIIMGFEVNSLPKTIKDEDYLTDDLLEILNLNTTTIMNKNNNQNVIIKINGHKNLFISYKTNGSNGECYPSSLIDELYDINIIDELKTDKIYSNLYAQIKLAKQLDLYVKYGTITNELKQLNNKYTISYLKYNHKYKYISKDKIKNYLQNHSGITVSYSDLDLYMKCSFSYYLKKLLKITDYQETFQALIGSYFHHVLELIRNNDFDLETEKELFFKDKNLSNKELFLLRKIELELIKTIEVVKYQESLSSYNNFCFEERIELDRSRDIPIVVKGFIDKIMIDTNITNHLALIDYKTGSYNNSLNNTIYGLDLQLPMYAYLVKNSPKFKEYKITGFYIAPILTKEDIANNSDTDTKRYENMKLQGYSTDDEIALERFDKTYKDSEVIKSMKITSNGFGPYSKILSEEKMNNLIKLVGLKIDDMINGILDSKFDINPKYLDGKNKACTYCKYKDICYHDYLDNIYLKNQEYKEFLGGESID